MIEMLSQLGAAFSTMFYNIGLALPGFIAAILVIILGYIIAAVISWAVIKLLHGISLDKKIQKYTKSEWGKAHISGMLGAIIKWYIFIVFIGTAVELVDLGVLSGFLITLANWLPNLIVAVILVLLALLLAEYVDNKIQNTKIKGAEMVGRLLYSCIIIIVGVIALNQIGIDVSLLENLILAIVGAMAIGIALALGISLGLGMKDDAKKFVKQIRK